jgi:hypothetical protein
LWKPEHKLVHSCFTLHSKVFSMANDLETLGHKKVTNLPTTINTSIHPNLQQTSYKANWKNNLSQSKLTCQTCDSVIRLKWFHRKQIETNYEAQFLINTLLKDEIEKKNINIKQGHNKTTWVNLG